MLGVMDIYLIGEPRRIRRTYSHASADVIDSYFNRFMFPPQHIDHVHWDIFDV
jgi:hypothetical protein